ncbi:MAG: L,D-transpeptidase [Gammaproteobacteria bacterium]|nr:MAG: L,D-transpeptidase [Gammaproteobacteria bacterium]
MKSTRPPVRLLVSLPEQRLALVRAERIERVFPVSTAARGAGERIGSQCTPRGWHQVRARIGAGCPRNAIFRARRPTGEILTPERYAREPGRDWILTRILWLSGLEPGFNRMGPVDTFRRYIYIHGTPDAEPIGVPASHGCIRMRNADIEWLFDRVPVGCRVLIREAPLEAMLGERGP